MKDRENNPFEGVQLPPAWCSGICRNAMNQICVEHCAIQRDCSAFEPKPNLKLTDMPRFPETSGMTKEEKFTSVTIYLAKVVDHLQGVEEEPRIYPPPRRAGFRNSESHSFPENLGGEDLLTFSSENAAEIKNVEDESPCNLFMSTHIKKNLDEIDE